MPGTVSAKPTRTPKKKPGGKTNEDLPGNSNHAEPSLSDGGAAEARVQIEDPMAGEIETSEKSSSKPAPRKAAGGNKKAQRKSGI